MRCSRFAQQRHATQSQNQLVHTLPAAARPRQAQVQRLQRLRAVGPRAAAASSSSSSSSSSNGSSAARAAPPAAPAAVAAAPAAVAAAAPTDYFSTDKRPVILFDGVCNLCNGGVNFVLDWDRDGAFRLAALQSNPGRQLLVRCSRAPDDISSIVLVEEGRHYVRSDAVLRIATRLGAPLPLLAALLMPLPKALLRDPVYDQVAANRYVLFGRQSSCRVSDARFAERFLGD